MKKVLQFLMIISYAITFAACGWDIKTEFASSSELLSSDSPANTPNPIEAKTFTPPIAGSDGDWYAPIIEAYAAFELSNHTVYDESIISETLLEYGQNNAKYGFSTASYAYALLDLNGSGEEVLLIGLKDYPVDTDCIYAYKDGRLEIILQSEYFRNSLRIYADNFGGNIIAKVDNSGDTSEQYIYNIDENFKTVLLNHFSLRAELDAGEINPHVAKINMVVEDKEIEISFDEYNIYMEQYGMPGLNSGRKPRYIEPDWNPVVNSSLCRIK